MADGFQPRRILSLVFILGIAVVFTLQFGPASSSITAPTRSAGPSSAAVVNGKEIPAQEFTRAYASQLQFFRSRGNPIPENLARQIGIPQQVLEQLVNAELLAQAAHQRGIVPADAELRELIHQNPDFGKEGRFDFNRYKEVLAGYYRKTAPEYEDELRRRLAAAKLVELVASGAFVSEDELKTRFEKDGNQAKVVFTRFLPAFYAAKVGTPTPAQLTAYQQAHEKEIAAYYEANRFLYQKAEQVRARQIFLKFAANATDAQKAEVRTQAEALRKSVDGGKDFAAVAKESSQDPGTQANGGDVGWVEKSVLPPELAQAAFALKPGEVSAPVVTPAGVFLMKVEEKKAAENRPLAEVQGEIARSLYVKDQAKSLAEADAKKALAKAQAGQKLTQLFPPEKDGQPALLRFETETRPEAVETDTFTSSGESIPHLGLAPELVKAVFKTDAPQVLGQVFPAGEGFVVAQVTERKKPLPEDFAKEKENLFTQARQAKQIELREAFVKALRKQGKVVTHPEVLDNTDAT